VIVIYSLITIIIIIAINSIIFYHHYYVGCFRDGRIDFHEFYYRLAPPLVGRRAKVVSDVFHKLDKSGDGFLQAYDIVGEYSRSTYAP